MTFKKKKSPYFLQVKPNSFSSSNSLRSLASIFMVGAAMVFPGFVQAQVTVYQHCNYGGYKVEMPEGEYTLSDFKSHDKDLKNDDVSSIVVEQGYKVTLYADANYKGQKLTITDNTDCLVNDRFNDIMSSIKVERVGQAAPDGHYGQQDIYAKTSNAAIRGSNQKTLKNVTVDQCKTACSSETSFVCKSFDYTKAAKVCDLSKDSRDTKKLKTDYANNSHDHYSRYYFNLTPNAAISGHNNKELKNISPSQCQTACVEETAFVCKSFDYTKKYRTCDLSEKSASDVTGGLKTNYPGNPYDHYALGSLKKTNEFTMAVLSDTQFGYCVSSLCDASLYSAGSYERPNSSLKANQWHSESIKKLQHGSSNFEGLIVNGDLTNTMDPDELENYIRYYAHVFRTYSGLGNHDYQNYVIGDTKTCGAGITHKCAQDMIKFLAQDVQATGVAKDFAFHTANDDIWGSLVYYWDIGNYRFIQLNNHPDFEVGFDTKLWGGAPLDNVGITKGWHALKDILDKPDSAGKNIILNMHIILTGNNASEAMGQWKDGGDIKQDADLARLTQDFLEVYPNIRAIFGGHLHDQVGQFTVTLGKSSRPNVSASADVRKQIETSSGRIVPVLFGGSAETNHYMEVVFKEDSFKANVIYSGSGNLTRTGDSNEVTW